MNDDEVKLFLCGDVMTGRGIDQILPYPSNPHLYEGYVSDARDYVILAEEANGAISKPVDFAYVWGDGVAELERQGPDVRIINLETSITTSNDYQPKGINYRMNPANVPCLGAAQIDCCMLANNHVLDWGLAGLSETLTTLDRAGLKHVGAGRNQEEAEAPVVLPLSGKRRVVVYGFGVESSGIGHDWRAGGERGGVNLLSDLSDKTVEHVAAQVADIKQTGDIVVASIHWGANWGYAIPPDQRRFAHALIDMAYVDVVHGHSSHHVKGIEVYRERPIMYGCGDLLSDYEGIGNNREFRDDLSLMYFPVLDATTGRLRRFELTAMRLKKMRINNASASESHWLAALLSREGKALGTAASIEADNRLLLHWE